MRANALTPTGNHWRITPRSHWLGIPHRTRCVSAKDELRLVCKDRGGRSRSDAIDALGHTMLVLSEPLGEV